MLPLRYIACIPLGAKALVQKTIRDLAFNENGKITISLLTRTNKNNEEIFYARFLVPQNKKHLNQDGIYKIESLKTKDEGEAILKGNTIKVFNNGNLYRDFTYIDDVVDAILKLIFNPAKPNKDFDRLNPNPSSSWAPHRILNIGNNNPVNINDFIEIIEDELGIKANKIFTTMRPGDVKKTFADLKEIEKWIGYEPKINIKEGMKRFIKWYKSYYDHS